jgi:hypothetical protein
VTEASFGAFRDRTEIMTLQYVVRFVAHRGIEKEHIDYTVDSVKNLVTKYEDPEHDIGGMMNAQSLKQFS